MSTTQVKQDDCEPKEKGNEPLMSQPINMRTMCRITLEESLPNDYLNFIRIILRRVYQSLLGFFSQNSKLLMLSDPMRTVSLTKLETKKKTHCYQCLRKFRFSVDAFNSPL